MSENPPDDTDRPSTEPDGADELDESAADKGGAESVLLSDEPTVDLIARAKDGDMEALRALLQRSLPPLMRWTHGRLPSAARGSVETADLVQQAVTNMLTHLDRFEPRAHVGAMQAYLRRSVLNDIRSRMRVVARRDVHQELPDDLAADQPDPLDEAIASQSFERYRTALATLNVRDRELIVARVECEWTVEEVRDHFGFNTNNAVRMALVRAMRRLRAVLGEL